MVEIDGKTRRIGLALSGGGFRAAAFHLGVFRRLKSLGLLWKIDLITCVSGGSIAGAILAANWGRDGVLDELESYLRTKSIAVSSVIGGLVDPFHSRLEKLAESYDRDLFHGVKLQGLAGGPRLYLNATNLSTGNLFFFVAGGEGPAELGEHEFGVFPADDFPVCKAVAASSSFPPVFPPLRIDSDVYPAKEVEYVTLSDGGIYDNLGVNPMVRERNALDYAVVSDAGKPFAVSSEPTESGAIVLRESISILMEQVRGLQFRRLQLGELSGKGPKPLWFSIDSEIGQSQEGDAAFASAIETNLRRLGSAEVGVLARHAGALLHHRISTYAPELLGAR